MGENSSIMGKRYWVFVKKERDEFLEFEERLSNVLNKLGYKNKNSSVGMADIFVHGVDSYEAELGDQLDAEEQELIELERIRKERERERGKLRSIGGIYESEGWDAFAEHCRKFNRDPEATLQQYNDLMILSRAGATNSQRFEAFLRRVLGDNQSHATEEIRKLANEEGLLTSDADWVMMRQVASRCGFSNTGHKGSWQL